MGIHFDHNPYQLRSNEQPDDVDGGDVWGRELCTLYKR